MLMDTLYLAFANCFANLFQSTLVTILCEIHVYILQKSVRMLLGFIDRKVAIKSHIFDHVNWVMFSYIAYICNTK